MTGDVRLSQFRLEGRIGIDIDGELGTVVARFTALFGVHEDTLLVPGWQLVQFGPQRFQLGSPEVIGPTESRERIGMPERWTMRLLARAMWRYKAEIDPQAVSHLGSDLRADLGLEVDE